jgi:PAS domain S-box-containing protein/putative nucleotidyltransferase with HDIG domain
VKTHKNIRNANSEILIVEDSPTQAEQLKFVLEKYNYVVQIAHDGKEALSLVQKDRPLIIISDILMPEMDGYEFCRHVKANAKFKDIPFVLLTTLSDPEDVIKALECGADNFITKPCDEKSLIARIQHLASSMSIEEVDGAQLKLAIRFGKHKYTINSNRLQIFNLLLSTYETAVQKNKQLARAEEEVRKLNEDLEERIRERTAALLASEEKYRLLVENANEAILVIQGDQIKFANAKAAHVWGYSIGELVSMPFIELVSESDRPATEAYFSKKAVELIDEILNFRYVNKQGRIGWVEANGAPIIWEAKPAILAFITDITERKRAEKALQERVKELRCIADISRLAEEPGISIEKFVQEVVSILPSAWLYPEICSARITMDSKEFKTANFRETEWSQSADIKVDRMKFGALTVCYLEEKPEADEGPFFKEERSLINTVADFMGHVIQHRRTEVEIRDSEKRFRTIFDSANDGMLLADMEGKKFHSGNAAIYRMLGYSQEEIKKMGITDIHPEKDIPHVIEQFEKQTRKEIAIAQSLPMKRKDGSVFYADISSAPVEISGKRYLLGIFRDITERKRAEEQLQKSLQQTKKVLEDVVLTLSSIVEKRDPYTAGHQHRVADLACAIAGELNLPEVQIEGIRVAGIIHDIGKINVPAEILSKTGRLSDAEFNIIKTHAQVGKEILEPINFPWPVAQVVHQHHERLNGTGYPQGLSAEKIILEAKIIAVADVVEAMASHRPYRPALGIDKALEEISNKSGILYAPQVVDACRELFDKKGYKLA